MMLSEGICVIVIAKSVRGKMNVMEFVNIKIFVNYM